MTRNNPSSRFPRPYQLSVAGKAASVLMAVTLASCSKLPVSTAPGVAFASDPIQPALTPVNVTATLPPGVTPLSLTFDKTTADVSIGTTLPITATLGLSDGTSVANSPVLLWSSDHPNIATVSKSGVVTPVAVGTCKITAQVQGVAATLSLVVSAGQFIWQQVNTNVPSTLLAVKLVSDYEAWAVGAHATIMHYLNGTWVQDTSAATATATLRSVSFINSSEGWAVGGDGSTGLILHYTGGRWQSVPSPASGVLTGVSMISSTEVWASGYNSSNQSIALHYNGTAWSTSSLNVSSQINSISAVTPNNVWAAGTSSILARPGIYQYDGTSWSSARFSDTFPYYNLNELDRTYSINSIKMLNGSTGWAVGSYTSALNLSGQAHGVLFSYQWVNNYWAEGTFGAGPNNEDLSLVPLNGVGMLNGSTGWVLGKTVNATAWYQFGQAPQPIYGNLFDNNANTLTLSNSYQINTMPPSFNGIDVLPDGNAIIVGDNGFIMMHTYDLTAALNSYGSTTTTFNSGSTVL